MLPKGILHHLVLGIILIPVFTSSSRSDLKPKPTLSRAGSRPRRDQLQAVLSTLEGPNPETVRVWSKHVNYAYLSEEESSVGSLKGGGTMASTEPTSIGVSFLGHYEKKRYGRQAPEEEPGGPCETFAIGNEEQKTFFSPGHPENYPNKTDCFKVLSAGKGQVIKLDWRNVFDIEQSDGCQFDYLEIRDGLYGYSTLLGKFCGKEFPPLLTSQGRHLWMHFHSDENIEYGGFTAVYEFTQKPTTSDFQPDMDECIINMDTSEGIIKSKDIDPVRIKNTIDYGIPLDCMWIVTVEANKKIFLTFNNFSLSKPNDCDNNIVDIFSYRTDQRVKTFCGSIADNLETPGNVFHLRYMVYPKAIGSSFELLYTAYREKSNDQECNEDEYDCEDNTCIAQELRCNGNFNCRLKWDEDKCAGSKDSGPVQSEHIVIILVVFSLILFGMSAAFVFNCVNKLIRDHRIIQEHIRQSQEGNLDTAGRLPTKVSEPERTKKITSDQEIGGLSPMSSTEHLENADCYVPGVGEILPILLQINKTSNGDASTPSQHQTESDSDDQDLNRDPPPQMCDSCCQTRESLFHTPPFLQNRSSDGSFTPSVDYSRKPTRDRTNYQHQSTAPFSTFGYSGSTMPKVDSRQSSSRSNDPKYKAEAVIEMERYGEDNGNFEDSRKRDIYRIEDQINRNNNGAKYAEHAKKQLERRPYSVETTKSAPDVIIMTKSH